MKLIAIKRPSSEKLDRLVFVRTDGSRCEIEMPRQGVLPHDLVHWVVEQGLGLRGGFLSLVARGGDARFVMELTHDPSNRSTERDAIHAEALVEALQTQLWSGSFDHEAFAYGLLTACEARGIEPGESPDVAVARGLFDRAVELDRQWAQVPPHGTLELVFAPGAA